MSKKKTEKVSSAPKSTGSKAGSKSKKSTVNVTLPAIVPKASPVEVSALGNMKLPSLTKVAQSTKSEPVAKASTPAAKVPAAAAKVPAVKAAAADVKKPKASAKKAVSAKPEVVITNDDIGLRAYYIAESRLKMGWAGDTTSDWVEAERQLVAEAKKKR
jgi:hypothetical protein